MVQWSGNPINEDLLQNKIKVSLFLNAKWLGLKGHLISAKKLFNHSDLIT